MRAARFAILLLPMVMAFPPAFATSEADKVRAEWRRESLRDLESGDAAEQIRAAKSLDVVFAAKTAPLLAKHLSHADAAIRLSAASLLWTLAGKSATAFEAARPALRAALDDPDGAVAMNAAGALSAMKEPAESLATRALERLVDTRDRAVLEPIRDQLRITRSARAELLPILHRFSPRPDDWTALLLDHAASADRDTAYAAWSLLGEQDDPASLALWAPRAAAALAVAEQRENAMRALGRAAGRTAIGLPELAAVAANPAAPEEQRLRALEILGSAADTQASGRDPQATRAAQAQWLAACEPVLKAGKPGKAFEACIRPSSFAFADRKDQARHLARWLAENPDPAAKVEFLGRLEGLWSDAFDATDTVRAEFAHGDPRVKQAAEKALDRIRPAWRESGARQARQTTSPAPKAAAAPAGSAPGADPEVKDVHGDNLFDRAKHACPAEVMKALGG